MKLEKLFYPALCLVNLGFGVARGIAYEKGVDVPLAADIILFAGAPITGAVSSFVKEAYFYFSQMYYEPEGEHRSPLEMVFSPLKGGLSSFLSLAGGSGIGYVGSVFI